MELALVLRILVSLTLVGGGVFALWKGGALFASSRGPAPDGSTFDLKIGPVHFKSGSKTIGSVLMVTSSIWAIMAWASLPKMTAEPGRWEVAKAEILADVDQRLSDTEGEIRSVVEQTRTHMVEYAGTAWSDYYTAFQQDQREWRARAMLPIGSIVLHTGSDAARELGWLPCDGAEVRAEEFTSLARLLGSRFGKSSPGHVKLPNLRAPQDAPDVAWMIKAR